MKNQFRESGCFLRCENAPFYEILPQFQKLQFYDIYANSAVFLIFRQKRRFLILMIFLRKSRVFVPYLARICFLFVPYLAPICFLFVPYLARICFLFKQKKDGAFQPRLPIITNNNN